MLGPPVDAWYVWLGVALVSIAVLGVVAVATPEPPSTAEAAADTIEEVAASRAPATAARPIDAERVRFDAYNLTIDGDTATLDHGRMTPAPRGTDLRRVALGAHPLDVFDSPEAFLTAARDARSTERIVEPTGDELIVRKLTYGGNDVVLVTA